MILHTKKAQFTGPRYDTHWIFGYGDPKVPTLQAQNMAQVNGKPATTNSEERWKAVGVISVPLLFPIPIPH